MRIPVFIFSNLFITHTHSPTIIKTPTIFDSDWDPARLTPSGSLTLSISIRAFEAFAFYRSRQRIICGTGDCMDLTSLTPSSLPLAQILAWYYCNHCLTLWDPWSIVAIFDYWWSITVCSHSFKLNSIYSLSHPNLLTSISIWNNLRRV